MKADIAERAAVLRALAHPARLGIAERLAIEGEICACDFTEHFGVSQPTISGHLKVLRTSGVVHTRRNGTQVCYSLSPDLDDQLAAISDALTGRALHAPA
ncbi:MAG: ArsR/SmtB family transcription factor [Thermoleophilaceae bacterium]